MNYNKLRPYTVVTMILALVLLAIIGGILYFAPQGLEARGWTSLGLRKHQLKDIHFLLGFIVLILVIIHGFFNLSAIKNYLKPSSKVWTYPLLSAVVLVFFTVIMALLL